MSEYQKFSVEELKIIFSNNLFRRSKQRMNLTRITQYRDVHFYNHDIFNEQIFENR